MTIASRFQVVEKPLLAPYYDIVDNTPDGACFDLGLDLDHYEGIVYIKVAHIEEMARVLGYISPNEADELKCRNQELEAEIERLPQKTEGFLNGIERLVNEYRSTNSDISSDWTAGIFGEDSPESASGEPVGESKESGTDSKPVGKDNGKVSGNSGNSNRQKSKPALGEGSDIFPADSGNEFSFGATGTS